MFGPPPPAALPDLVAAADSERPGLAPVRPGPMHTGGKIVLEPSGCLGEQHLRGVAPLDSRQTGLHGCAEHLEGHLVGAGVEMLLYPGADSVI